MVTRNSGISRPRSSEQTQELLNVDNAQVCQIYLTVCAYFACFQAGCLNLKCTVLYSFKWREGAVQPEREDEKPDFIGTPRNNSLDLVSCAVIGLET